jgi:hypothetical protein
MSLPPEAGDGRAWSRDVDNFCVVRAVDNSIGAAE